YVGRVHAAHDPALVRAFAVPDDIPQIMVGPSEGRLLYLLAKLVRAKKIVEVGTLVGYSTIHLARGLVDGGHVWSIQYEPRHAEVARETRPAAKLGDRATVLGGAGADVLPTLSAHAPVDIVFIDADKVSYEIYGRWAIEHLRPGGLVIGDNAYLFGELLDDS